MKKVIFVLTAIAFTLMLTACPNTAALTPVEMAVQSTLKATPQPDGSVKISGITGDQNSTNTRFEALVNSNKYLPLQQGEQTVSDSKKLSVVLQVVKSITVENKQFKLVKITTTGLPTLSNKSVKILSEPQDDFSIVTDELGFDKPISLPVEMESYLFTETQKPNCTQLDGIVAADFGNAAEALAAVTSRFLALKKGLVLPKDPLEVNLNSYCSALRVDVIKLASAPLDQEGLSLSLVKITLTIDGNPQTVYGMIKD